MMKVSGIGIGYGDRLIVKNISFCLERGECVLLCGANGSGKSSLLRTLAGLQKPMVGDIQCRSATAMIPTKIPKVKGFTITEFIQSGCYRQSGIWGGCTAKMSLAISRAIKTLGIEDIAHRDVSTVSDGEFQKACIASALTRQADILLLDEPTAFLDVDSRIMVLDTLNRLTKEKNISLIFSSHDIYDSYGICGRIFGIGRDGVFRDSALSDKQEVLDACFERVSNR